MRQKIDPLDFGRIPVEFYIQDREMRWKRASHGERPSPRVILAYRHVFPDGYRVVCPITGDRDLYVHGKVNTFQFNILLAHHRYRLVTDADESDRYMKMYCRHFNIPRHRFSPYMSRGERTHFSLRRDGIDECPCKETFTM